jgi:hypothetical protein
MKKVLYVTSVILGLISIGIYFIGNQFGLPLFLESLSSGLFISFLTGAIVYFMTVDHPRKKLDQGRVELIKDELGYKLDRIKTRLNWLDGLALDSDAEQFKSKLSSMKYGDVTISKNKQTVYDTLHEIKVLVEEFRAFATPIILTLDDQDGKINGFRDYLQRPRVLSNERMFVRNDLNSIKDKSVEIGDQLYDLIIKLVILRKVL